MGSQAGYTVETVCNAEGRAAGMSVMGLRWLRPRERELIHQLGSIRSGEACRPPTEYQVQHNRALKLCLYRHES